jgi:hypothetical protein
MRIIHYSNESGSREGLAFTETNDDADDFVPYGCELISDIYLDIDLPTSFPSETTFEKVI